MPLKGNWKRCSARGKRNGEPCKNPAAIGFEVCRLHGAGTPSKGKIGGRPIVHECNFRTWREESRYPTELLQVMPMRSPLRKYSIAVSTEIFRQSMRTVGAPPLQSDQNQ